MTGDAYHFNLNDTLKLVEKYSYSVPRYTSYPTAQELRPCEDLSPIAQALVSAHSRQSRLSLYVHIPFCASLCYFCACNKVISTNPSDRENYLTTLASEIEILKRSAGGALLIDQVHIGGGSPSYLTEESMAELDRILTAGFEYTSPCEKSVELDPRTTTSSKIALLARQGYIRGSIGVQDLNPEVQEMVNRIQPYEMTRDAVQAMRDSGFKSVNIDLIYGLPGQSLASMEETLEKVLELRPDRIAFYGYAHVTWKVKVQKTFAKLPLPSPTERLALFHRGFEILTNNGYEHIGLDHFALPDDGLARARKNGTLRRNFMGYTESASDGIIALGMSGISDINGVLFQNQPSLELYNEAVEKKMLPISKVYVRTSEDKLREALIEHLMCHGSIAARDIEALGYSRSGFLAVLRSAEEALKKLAADDLLRFDDSSIVVKEKGLYFLRTIASSFDEYLPKYIQASQKTFSQGV